MEPSETEDRGRDFQHGRLLRVDEFAASQGISSEYVIEEIKAGQLAGELRGDQWYVDLLLSQKMGAITGSPGQAKFTMKQLPPAFAPALVRMPKSAVRWFRLFYLSGIWSILIVILAVLSYSRPGTTQIQDPSEFNLSAFRSGQPYRVCYLVGSQGHLGLGASTHISEQSYNASHPPMEKHFAMAFPAGCRIIGIPDIIDIIWDEGTESRFVRQEGYAVTMVSKYRLFTAHYLVLLIPALLVSVVAYCQYRRTKRRGLFQASEDEN